LKRGVKSGALGVDGTNRIAQGNSKRKTRTAWG
jgi:hypothetical protein